MLSDEEKKAIEIRFQRNLELLIRNKISPTATEIIVAEQPMILLFRELIYRLEKQSKEIEELKEENKEIREWKYVIDNPIDLEKLKELDLIKIKGKEYISKDKIKAKIEEYYEYDKRMQNKPDWHTTKYYEAKALEKLLEE